MFLHGWHICIIVFGSFILPPRLLDCLEGCPHGLYHLLFGCQQLLHGLHCVHWPNFCHHHLRLLLLLHVTRRLSFCKIPTMKFVLLGVFWFLMESRSQGSILLILLVQIQLNFDVGPCPGLLYIWFGESVCKF